MSHTISLHPRASSSVARIEMLKLFWQSEKGLNVSDSVLTVPQDGFVDPPVGLDPKVEKKLLRRIDGYVISVLGALYLMSFLDRGNIGSANVATPSISKATGMNAQQYGAVVSIVYATYVVFEPVWANLLKIISPKILLGGTTFCWGIITLGTAWAKNYNQLIALRVLLGVFEAGLFPCITVYVLMNYRREETGRRMSYVFSCAAFAGAVGGLIAGGLVRIETGNITGWQYLYIVEGSISLVLAPIAYFWIPNQMEHAWFLNAEQRAQAAVRYEMNKRNYSHEEKFSWTEVGKALKDWHVYAAGTVQFCADITLYGISTFMPQIIRAMGFSNINANLLTVPVQVVGATSFLIVAWFSDKYEIRSYFIIFGLSLNLIGYIILATVESVGGRYFALFVVASGLYITPGLNVTWIGNNTAGHYKRSTAVGLNQLIGNSSGAAIGTIFLGTLAPRYLRSMYIAIGLTILGIVTAALLSLDWRRENARREKLVAAGALDQPELGDKNPHFRYLL